MFSTMSPVALRNLGYVVFTVGIITVHFLTQWGVQPLFVNATAVVGFIIGAGIMIIGDNKKRHGG